MKNAWLSWMTQSWMRKSMISAEVQAAMQAGEMSRTPSFVTPSGLIMKIPVPWALGMPFGGTRAFPLRGTLWVCGRVHFHGAETFKIIQKTKAWNYGQFRPPHGPFFGGAPRVRPVSSWSCLAVSFLAVSLIFIIQVLKGVPSSVHKGDWKVWRPTDTLNYLY